MRQFWYLTKGKLNERGTDLRAFSKAPRAGTPFIAVDYDRKARAFKLYDDNGNFIREYSDETIEPRRYRDHPLDRAYNPEYMARESPDLGSVVHAELHKMRFERGLSGNGKELNESPHRMMDDYVDRKKKTTKAKPKRKPVKKCKCK
jgi:hypothetical protein